MKKLRTLEVLRNLKSVQYKLGQISFNEYNDLENKLSKHLNNK